MVRHAACPHRNEWHGGGVTELTKVVEAEAEERPVGGDCECVCTTAACVCYVLVVEGGHDVRDELGWVGGGVGGHDGVPGVCR